MSGIERELDQMPRWRALTDADREREYSPSSCIGGTIKPFIDEYEIRSSVARHRFSESGPAVTEIRYGSGRSHTLDVVVPTGGDTPHPILVFLHGGYWQLLSKRESLFAAEDCVENHIAFAAVDYTLAPDASLDEIVAECRAAMAALRAVASDLNIDGNRIVVSGSSAGAHLSAMVGLGADDGWRPAAVALISGIFEVEPLIGTSINDAVGLDIESAHRNSPMLRDLVGFPPALIVWGQNETREFKRQSGWFATLLENSGVPALTMEIESKNHFDVVLDLGNTSTPLGAAMIKLVHDPRSLRAEL